MTIYCNIIIICLANGHDLQYDTLPSIFLKKYMTTTNKGLYSMKVSFTMNLVTSTMRCHGES
jgi:ubiquitin C-terminal hydrolase